MDLTDEGMTTGDYDTEGWQSCIRIPIVERDVVCI